MRGDLRGRYNPSRAASRQSASCIRLYDQTFDHAARYCRGCYEAGRSASFFCIKLQCAEIEEQAAPIAHSIAPGSTRSSARSRHRSRAG